MLTSWASLAPTAMGMKDSMSLAMIAVTNLGAATHSGSVHISSIDKYSLTDILLSFRFLLEELTVSQSMMTPVVVPWSAELAMGEMAHAAMSTPARMFSPSDVALTTFASNRRPWRCQWRWSTPVSWVCRVYCGFAWNHNFSFIIRYLDLTQLIQTYKNPGLSLVNKKICKKRRICSVVNWHESLPVAYDIRRTLSR